MSAAVQMSLNNCFVVLWYTECDSEAVKLLFQVKLVWRKQIQHWDSFSVASQQ